MARRLFTFEVMVFGNVVGRFNVISSKKLAEAEDITCMNVMYFCMRRVNINKILVVVDM